MQYTRVGTQLTITAPDMATAETLERLCRSWPVAEAEASHDLGNLTEYHAARQALKARVEALGEERDAINRFQDADASTKLPPILYEIEVVNAVLRATLRDTNPT